MTPSRLFLKMCAYLPSLFCLSLLFLCFPLSDAVSGILAVTLHECGHLVFYYLCRRRLPRFHAQAGGFLLTSEPMPACHELLYAGGGVLFNLLSLLPAALLFSVPACADFAAAFFAFSLLYALFNLIPAPPLDGAKLLYLGMSAFLGDVRACRFLKLLSGGIIFFLLFFSLYSLLGSGGFLYGIFLSFRLLTAYFETF